MYIVIRKQLALHKQGVLDHTHTRESVEKSESLSVRAVGVGLESSSVQQEEPVRTDRA